jgi:arylsulfatase A
MARRELTRRDFLAGAGRAATLGALGLAASASRVSAQPSEMPPNFVLVMLDDLGYGDLGCYGSELIQTPNIDSLASGGARFTQAYSGAPVCTPSRVALLTGRYGARAGLPLVLSPADPGGLPAEERTVAEYLKQAGYATGIFGKWHLGSRREYNPTRYGFDRFFGALHSNDMPPFELWENEQVVESRVDQSLLTRRYTEEAVRFIGQSSRPFFVYLPYTMPHIPLHTEPRFRGFSKAGLYGDVVESVDHYVGELADSLEEAGLLEETLILVTSDNGPWFSGSTGGLRGRKAETYEGGMRVPLVAHWPAEIPSGVTREQPVSAVDLLPTLCSLAGVEPDPEIALDGREVSGVMRSDESLEPAPIYFFSDENLNAVRCGDWKLHVRRSPFGVYGPEKEAPELFDLHRDPSESYDLAERNPELVGELRDLIEGFGPVHVEEDTYAPEKVPDSWDWWPPWS